MWVKSFQVHSNPSISLKFINLYFPVNVRHKITLFVNLDPDARMRPRPPNFYFPDSSFSGIRRRLLRLAHDLRIYTTPDALYEEILDCFTSFGEERTVSTLRGIPELPWAPFIPDSDAEVKIPNLS